MRRPEQPKRVTAFTRIDAQLDERMREASAALGIDPAEFMRRAIELKLYGPETPAASLTVEEEAVLFAWRTLRLCSPQQADAVRLVLQALLDSQPAIVPPPSEDAVPTGVDPPKKRRRG